MGAENIALRYAQAVGKALGISVVAGTEDDDYLVELDGWVYVSAEEIQIVYPSVCAETAETIKVPGFVVSYTTLVHGSYWEPDDADIVDEGEYRVMTDAIKAAFLLVQDNKISQLLQAEGENMHAESLSNVQIDSE